MLQSAIQLFLQGIPLLLAVLGFYVVFWPPTSPLIKLTFVAVLIGLAALSIYHTGKQNKKIEARNEKIDAILNEINSVKPTAQIGAHFVLLLKRAEQRVEVQAELRNYGMVTAEELGSYGSAVFGSPPDMQLIGGSFVPNVRLNPKEQRSILFASQGEVARELISRVNRKQPIMVTVNMLYKANGVQYSHRIVASYVYMNETWASNEDRVVKGIVAFPAAVFADGTVFTANVPWLPPQPK